MKIFIMGPEGAGKTVLLASLSRYVAKREDLVLCPIDFPTSSYIATVLKALEAGEWPRSTRQAELRMLKWKFGRTDEPLNEISMFDAAGQDLRQILLNPSGTTGRLGEIQDQVNEADVLVYLLNLEDFLETKDLEKLNESAELFKSFLTYSRWREKRRIVVISKADRFEAILKGEKRMKHLLKSHFPKTYSFDHILDQEKSVTYISIASVETELAINESGEPVLKPKLPLRQGGMHKLVNALLRSVDELKRAGRPDKNRAWNKQGLDDEPISDVPNQGADSKPKSVGAEAENTPPWFVVFSVWIVIGIGLWFALVGLWKLIFRLFSP